jgi:ferredoxin-thioredoxin reductase catalytic subunit
VTSVDKLYEMLKKAQELKGYFFNKDKETVFGLLDGLIKNSERYGYMSCPCRLSQAIMRKTGILSVPAFTGRMM